MGRLSPTPHRARLRRLAFILLLATGLAVPGGELLADDDHERAKALKEAGDILPLAEIIERALGVRPGRVLEVELETKRGRYRYDLEILDEDGVVWELTFDARTGELLKREEDDEP